MKLKALDLSQQQAQGVIKNAEKERQGVEAQLEAMDPATRLHAEQRKNADISAAIQQKEGVIAQYTEQARRLMIMIGETRDAQVRASLEARLKTVEHAEAQAQGVVDAMKKQQSGVVAQMKSTQAALSAENSNPIVNMIHGIGQAWQSIQPGLQQAGSLILQVLREVGGYLRDTFAPLWKQLVDLWNQTMHPAITQLRNALKPLMPLFESIAALVGGVLALALGILVGALKGVISFIASFISGLMTFFGGIVQFITGIVQIVSGILRFIHDLFTGNFSKLHGDLGTILDGVANLFKGLGNMILGFLRATVGSVFSLLGGFVSGFLGFFKHLWDMLVGHSIIPDLVKGIVSWIASLPGKVLGFVEHLVSGFIGLVAGLPGKILSILGHLKDQALGALGSLVTGAINVGKNMIAGLGNAIKNGIGGVLGGIKDAAGNIGGAIASFLHFSKPEEGPLSEVDQWMPDFGQKLSDGLVQVVPVVNSALLLLTREFQQFDTGVLTRTTNMMTMLIAMSRTWGQELVLGLTAGIAAATPLSFVGQKLWSFRA